MVAHVEKRVINIYIRQHNRDQEMVSRNMNSSTTKKVETCNPSMYVCTFPSYSFLRRTSGAMYAGVPTVDFGCE
jgi:hypothetical protein